ncbi:MAG TPA: histidine phosphatase family protein [Phenylobacterium sp.]
MIYLVRHGQTEFNLVRRYQGALDSPLTEQGVGQARRIGALLGSLVGGQPGWELVASPQGRAWRTAELVNETLGLALTPEPRLREISLGSWDGRLISEVEARLPPEADPWERFFYSPDGDSYETIAERVLEWLGEVEASGRKVVAVSHGVTGRIIRGLYGRLSRPDMLTLAVPQDAVFRLDGGRIERIDCPSEATA